MTASAGPALKRLHREFGDRVAFLTLYVREAHPGEHVPQATTAEQKMAHARAYRKRDGLSWPVAVDAIDGELHRQLDPKPNAAYLIDANGNVAFRALWSNDERALREGLDAIVSGPPGAIGEREPRVVPMPNGLGTMDAILGDAGATARQDVLRQAPPMYAMARLAAFFGPLPPLGRGIIAAAIGMLGPVVLAGGLRQLLAWRERAGGRGHA
ncbi:MAG TPA: hypothetical protein VFL91_31995 [Thermomicrobiales bacterium]|nr:hypothetical protein [Thermomicrobiales bacterium]